MSTEQGPAVDAFSQARDRFPDHRWLFDVTEHAAALTAIAEVAGADATQAAFHRSALVRRARKIIEVIEAVRLAEAGAEAPPGGKVLTFRKRPS